MVSDYLKKKRILLVDDEKELRELVLSILREEGYGEDSRDCGRSTADLPGMAAGICHIGCDAAGRERVQPVR